MTFSKLKAWEIAQGYRNRDFSCEEVTREFLDNIKEKDKEINAYITVTEELALKKAKEVDEKFHNREEMSPLAGIPISIKDNISVKNVKMTCGSRMLENYISPYDATLVKKIKDNDGVILGKVNLDEFAMGASTRTSYFGVTKNPLDTTRVSGGSSGGSAASVSANMA
ncbi:MAG: amidase, partial [Peptoniphilus sp.]